MTFDPIKEALMLANDAEMILYGMEGPSLIPARRRQLDDARNTLVRFIKEMERVQQLRENDLQAHRDEPWIDAVGQLKEAPTS